MPAVAKKLWLFPTLTFGLAVLGDLLGFGWVWSAVTGIVSFPTALLVGMLLATKRAEDKSHLATGVWLFMVMSVGSVALLCTCFVLGRYAAAVPAFGLLVMMASMYLWGCDVNQRVAARKAAGEV